jgi:hypothetical protein
MKPAVKYSLVVALVVVLGAVFFMKKSSKEEAVTATNPSANKMTSVPVMPKENGESTKSAVAPVKKDLPANPYLNKESMASLPPTMKEFLLLDMKSIRNAQETKDYYELLRSRAAIEDAQKLLMNVKADNLPESEREHLTATRFLGRAMGDLNNKSNKELNEVVKKIILTDNLSGPESQKAKMIYAGDKAELVQTMIAFNQNIHKELLGRTKNANIKKIVENAYNYNEEMRVKN